MSAGLLFALSYQLYGNDYLDSSILYHMSRYLANLFYNKYSCGECFIIVWEICPFFCCRLDYRHNFSVHFLWVYLAKDSKIELVQKILFFMSTLPQVSPILIPFVISLYSVVFSCFSCWWQASALPGKIYLLAY